jgi:hypothetical protein
VNVLKASFGAPFLLRDNEEGLMNRTLRVLLPAVLFPASLFPASGLAVGGGLNISSTNAQDGEGRHYVPRLGFNAGVSFEQQVGKAGVLFVVPGVGLETRGETLEESAQGVRATRELLYLQMPLHAMLRVPVGRGAVAFFLGPSLGVNLASKERGRDPGGSYEVNLDDRTSVFEFGIEAGIGAEFSMGPGHAFIRPSFHRGVSHPFEEDPGITLRTFQVKMGYRFSFDPPAGASQPPAPPPVPPEFEPEP